MSKGKYLRRVRYLRRTYGVSSRIASLLVRQRQKTGLGYAELLDRYRKRKVAELVRAGASLADARGWVRGYVRAEKPVISLRQRMRQVKWRALEEKLVRRVEELAPVVVGVPIVEIPPKVRVIPVEGVPGLEVELIDLPVGDRVVTTLIIPGVTNILALNDMIRSMPPEGLVRLRVWGIDFKGTAAEFRFSDYRRAIEVAYTLQTGLDPNQSPPMVLMSNIYVNAYCEYGTLDIVGIDARQGEEVKESESLFLEETEFDFGEGRLPW